MVLSRYIAPVDPRDVPFHRWDAVVVGTGVAGLYTALKLAEWGDVALLCKGKLEDSNTYAAQGGIAAAIGPGDSPAFHEQDTLAAGAGLNDPAAVRVLVEEAPEAIHELVRLGVVFDRGASGYAFAREGAHNRARILHCGGDATGREIVRALSERVREHPRIVLFEETLAVDVLTVRGRCTGILALGCDGRWTSFVAPVTVLATGGAGQLYRHTTNPEGATGDGIAMAYRAGAEVRDLEFVQFHPTAFAKEGVPPFLLSEALRGEGAVLRNILGSRFMESYHPSCELAPRDVVARAIMREMEKTGASWVYLDITHQPKDWAEKRFPNIYHFCRNYGFDLSQDWIPVAPAAHYIMGGVATDLYGQTSVPGLYAVGETASNGVHGANRLASNSLLEGAVFARRVAERVKAVADRHEPVWPPGSSGDEPFDPDERTVGEGHEDVAFLRRELQNMMMKEVGVYRSKETLQRALEALGRWSPDLVRSARGRAEVEWVNLLTVAYLVVTGAWLRRESRGGHYRTDYPETNDQLWCAHLVLSRGRGVRKVRCGGWN
ncbi:MAG: L-aspartate oxidase [Alicyclobacillaceae bacterium]|nr:L-aspartate oxidase [Alicyclobacillaceae bacterium]